MEFVLFHALVAVFVAGLVQQIVLDGVDKAAQLRHAVLYTVQDESAETAGVEPKIWQNKKYNAWVEMLKR